MLSVRLSDSLFSFILVHLAQPWFLLGKIRRNESACSVTRCAFYHRPCWPHFLNWLSSWSGLNLTGQKLSLLKNQMNILGLRNNAFSAHYKSPTLFFFFFFLLAVVLQAEPIPLVTSLKILFPWLKTRLVLFPQYLHDLCFLLNAGKMKCNWGLHVSQELSAMVGESLPTITAART